MRSTRRASYSARASKDGPGTVINEADLGTGVDTIRPHKKVDAAGSIKLSNEFVGSLRKESSTGTSHRRMASEGAKAGKSIVEEVVLPVLQRVGLQYLTFRLTQADAELKAIRDDMDAREIESLSMLQRGFDELKEANAELAYNVILDILEGINECVWTLVFPSSF